MDSPTIAGTPAPIKVSCASALVKQNQQQQQQNQHSEQLIHGLPVQIDAVAAAIQVPVTVPTPSVPTKQLPLTFKCGICDQGFTYPKSLFLHFQQNHQDQQEEGTKKLRPFKCGQCTGKFSDLKDLKRHIFIHTGKKPFHCTICKMNVRRKDSLIRHLRTMHHQSEDEIHALVADLQSSSVQQNLVDLPGRLFSLKKRSIKKSKSKSQLPTAAAALPTPTSTSSESHQSNSVPPTTPTTRSLETEISVNQALTKESQDILPSQPLSTDSALQKPIRSTVIVTPASKDTVERPVHAQVTVTADSSLECPTIAKATKSQDKRKSEPVPTISCPECNKRFTQYLNLKRHMKCHSVGRKYFECTKCAKKCTTLQHLQEHYLIHSNEKPHTCQLCQKSFSTKSTLKKHTFAVHMNPGSRPYVCRICSKTFGLKSKCEAHLRRSHSEQFGDGFNNKPFICNICSHGFTTKTDLKRHGSIHTDEKAFKCCFCEAEFRRKDNFSRHLTTVHKLAQEQVKQIFLTILPI